MSTEARALAKELLDKLSADYQNRHVIDSLSHYEQDIDLISAFYAQAQRETWEQAALLGQEMIDAYPVDVFIEPPKGQHGETIDACSARAGRHLGKVFRDRCRQQAQEVGR